jgi:predicted phage tail protein
MLNAMEEMPAKVLLHGPLGEMFGREHSLHISSPAEAIRALCALRDGFRAELSRPGAAYSVLLGDAPLPLEGLGIGLGGRDVHIVPAVGGAKDANVTNIILGVAILAVVCIATYGAGAAAGTGIWASMTATTAGAMATSFGVALIVGGVAGLLSPTPSAQKPSESHANDPSRLFSGAVNTTAQSHPIQICYGEMEIGSALISTMIDYTYGSALG